MRKCIDWLKEMFVWFTSRRLLDAVNAGADDDELSVILTEEIERHFPPRRKRIEQRKELFVWLTSRRLRDAVNAGADDDELSVILTEEIERNFPFRKKHNK